MEHEYPKTYALIYLLIEELGRFEMDHLSEKNRANVLSTFAYEEEEDHTPDLVYFDKEMTESFYNLIQNKGNIRYQHLFQAAILQSIYVNSKNRLKGIISEAYSDYLDKNEIISKNEFEEENYIFESQRDAGMLKNIYYS